MSGTSFPLFSTISIVSALTHQITPSPIRPFLFNRKSKHRNRDNHGWRARYPTIVIAGAGPTTAASNHNIGYHTSGAAFEARERAGFGSGVEPLCGEGSEGGVFGSAAAEEVGGGGVRGCAGMLLCLGEVGMRMDVWNMSRDE